MSKEQQAVVDQYCEQQAAKVLSNLAVLSNGEHWKSAQFRNEMMDMIQCTEASLNC